MRRSKLRTKATLKTTTTPLLFGSAAGPPSKRRKGRHPTLGDDLFSIDELKRLTEEAEAGLLISGRFGGDEDEEEEKLDGLCHQQPLLLPCLPVKNFLQPFHPLISLRAQNLLPKKLRGFETSAASTRRPSERN